MQRGDPVYDLAILGSGPAGLSAAFAALARGARPKAICLCERAQTVLGGWRHKAVGASEVPRRETTWHTALAGLTDHAWLAALDPERVPDLLGQGLLPQVRVSLTERCLRAGIALRTGAKALEIGRDYNGHFRAWFETGVPLTAKRLIIATGGGKNHGFRWADEKGYQVEPSIPAGINLRLKESRKRTWSGLPPTPVQVSLDGASDRVDGEIEGPHPWLGGSALTSLSLREPAAFAKVHYKGSVQINWLCSGGEGVSSKDLLQFQEQAGRRTVGEYPWGDLEKTVWNTLMHRARVEPSTLWRALSQRELQHLASHFTRTQITFEGYRLDRAGGIAAGGIRVEELIPGTFESKREAGLFWIGELLDLHASRPGENLWLAQVAGERAAEAALASL